MHTSFVPLRVRLGRIRQLIADAQLPPKAISMDFEEGWWKVRFSSAKLNGPQCDWGDMRDEIMGWLYANCPQTEPRSYHQPRHARYVGFRREDDALLCLMRFS